jgi:hypothetical protein
VHDIGISKEDHDIAISVCASEVAGGYGVAVQVQRKAAIERDYW